MFVDEPTGRWNLWRTDATGSPATPVAPADADTGGGLWVLGVRWFAPLADGGVVAVRTNGSDALVRIDRDGTATPLDLGPALPGPADFSRDDHGRLWIPAMPENAVRILDPAS